MNTEEAIANLETRIAFQDRTIEELNQVVIAQQNSIEALAKRVTVVEQNAQSMDPSLVKDADQESPPPHY